MRIISEGMLKHFWTSHPVAMAEPSAHVALVEWIRFVRKAEWNSPAEIKLAFASASIIGDGRIVFNICGNKYRLVVWINFPAKIVYTRFIGTHAEYDSIDVRTI